MLKRCTLHSDISYLRDYGVWSYVSDRNGLDCAGGGSPPPDPQAKSPLIAEYSQSAS